MTWEDIRKHFPNCWVVMEAAQSHDSNEKWVPDDIYIMQAYADGLAAIKSYGELKRQWPGRKLFFYHTAHPTIEMKILRTVGPRFRVHATEPAR